MGGGGGKTRKTRKDDTTLNKKKLKSVRVLKAGYRRGFLRGERVDTKKETPLTDAYGREAFKVFWGK